MKTKRIQFNSTSLHALNHKKKISKMVEKVVTSGVFLHGEENQKLLENLRAYFQKNSITLCQSGHDALVLALQSLHLSPGDEVIFPVNAYPTAFAVALSKAKPVPVDVDENAQIDPNSLAKAITKKTKAIIMVHLYGLVGQIEKVKKLSQGITFIEDCAQSFGTTYKNKLTGTLGDFGCLSFYPTKNLGTLGDGGAIITKDKSIYTYLSKATKYGESTRYQSEFISAHSRIPEIQAGILNIYFKSLPKEIENKKKLYTYFQNTFKKSISNPNISLFISHPLSNPVPHLCVIKTKDRQKFQQHLKKKHLETFLHYPTPVHLIKAFEYLGYKKGDFPMAEKQAEEIISLPFHSYLRKKDIDNIVSSIAEYYG